MSDLSYGVEIEHGWGDDEAEISELGGVEWLKITPGLEKTFVVVLSDVQQIVRYWGHWWQPIGEFRRCSIPGKMPDMSCPLCRQRFARQERFVSMVWCEGRQFRWEFSPEQRRQIVAMMRGDGERPPITELRGQALGLWRMRARSPIMVGLAEPGDIDVPEPLPAPVDLDKLMSQQWMRQALRFGKRSEWSDLEDGHAKPGGPPQRPPSPANRQSWPHAAPASPPTSAAVGQSTQDSGEAAPSAFARDYFAKYGRWPKDISGP